MTEHPEKWCLPAGSNPHLIIFTKRYIEKITHQIHSCIPDVRGYADLIQQWSHIWSSRLELPSELLTTTCCYFQSSIYFFPLAKKVSWMGIWWGSWLISPFSGGTVSAVPAGMWFYWVVSLFKGRGSASPFHVAFPTKNSPHFVYQGTIVGILPAAG